ncbi:hypothetical protein JI664_18150 [Rhodobacter sp. NTK016B]|uniref:hypothetical protein n=1 Tax=Rhodobacter sp. NTK016B TaxID=2759676 RepID=UPI001A8FCCA7|nr:hypothetical protein [Rhodobacter sp. NTK016B]MBN8293899.1 hypothetical protein [Rhodobacter sp. NTK016B]
MYRLDREPGAPADESRAQAEAVERRLTKIAATFEHLDADHPHRAYGDFAALYLSTTRHWLARLAPSPESVFPLHVMPPFYALYAQHVVARIDAPLSRIAPHWRAYHRRTRSLRPVSAPLARFLALASGIRAHSHADMGAAILAAERSSGMRLDDHARHHMFDAVATRAFAEGAQAALGCSPMLEVTRPIWLPVLHHWRASGYRRQWRDRGVSQGAQAV